MTEYWRYLGMVQNGDGDVQQMVEKLAVEMADAAEVLSRREVMICSFCAGDRNAPS